MTTEHRNAPGIQLSPEVWTRMADHLMEIREDQKCCAHEIIISKLSILAASVSAGGCTDWSSRSVATVRTLGHEWAARHWPLDPLLDLLGRVAEEAVESFLASEDATNRDRATALRTIAEVSNRYIRELLNGFQEVGKQQDHPKSYQVAALTLLRGQQVPAHLRSSLAAAYGVIAFRIAPDDRDETERVTAWLDRQAAHGVLSVVCSQGGYVLAPARDIGDALAFAEQLRPQLPEATWTGVSWRSVTSLPAGRAEALEILASALASNRRPGYYHLGDVLVEYAVLQQPSVSQMLVKLIEPVVHNAVLLDTLNALLASNGNRSKAAIDLVIHRSTLDYRLSQIERLTGHAPSSSRALQVLGAALTAHGATKCAVQELSVWDL